MPRLFVAVDFPQYVVDLLAGLPHTLDGRWSTPEQMHLTVRFIGDVPQHRISTIDAYLQKVRTNEFHLRLKGLDHFNERTLWAAVDAPAELNILHARVEAALVTSGLSPDNRAYTPHVTLARFNRPPAQSMAQYINQYRTFETEWFPVQEFILYESDLQPDGARYIPLHRYPLVTVN